MTMEEFVAALSRDDFAEVLAQKTFDAQKEVLGKLSEIAKQIMGIIKPKATTLNFGNISVVFSVGINNSGTHESIIECVTGSKRDLLVNIDAIRGEIANI